jgi:uncharacterized RDD family membrane protein YckC
LRKREEDFAMVCPKCAADIPDDRAFCPGCGQPLISMDAPDAAPDDPAGERPVSRVRVKYAGFWLRLAAFMVDWLALSFLVGPLIAMLFPNLDFAAFPMVPPADPVAREAAFQRLREALPTLAAAELIVFVVMGVYFSLMESSVWQATLGKRLFGLQVTDLNYRRVSFARATGRHFAKLVSNLTVFVGFAMAGFTPRKQALHDLIAECLVIRRLPARDK